MPHHHSLWPVLLAGTAGACWALQGNEVSQGEVAGPGVPLLQQPLAAPRVPKEYRQQPPPRTVRNKVGAPGTKSARCDMRCQAGSHPWKGGDQPWGALHPLTRTHVPHPRATLWGFAVFSPRAGGGSQEEAPLGSNPVLPEAVSSHHHDGRDPSIAAGTASHQACGETATASVGQWPSATHTSTSNTAARSVGKSTASARPSGP